MSKRLRSVTSVSYETDSNYNVYSRYLIDNLDEEQKDEVRKERRRIQEQLRRLNRAQGIITYEAQ